MTTSLLTADNDVSVSIFHNEIPLEIEQELNRRYETLHASLPFFRVFRRTDNASCYVARNQDSVLDILVFRIELRRVLVLNEMFHIDAVELTRFVESIFNTFPRIDVISFNAIDCCTGSLTYPIQRFNAKDTYLVSLPATPEAYTAALGKTTRTSIRHQLNTASKTFPSLTMRYLVKEEIGEDTVRAIARLSEQRIRDSGAKFTHDVKRLLALARECGFVSLLCIDGKMCAGSVNYQIGRNFFGDITAYEPEYGRYGVGKLCTYLTICESIRRGGAKFYLGGGEFEFKQRLLGQRIGMDELQVYRTTRRLLANVDCVLQAFARCQLRRLKTALHQRKSSRAGTMAFRALHALKNKFAK